MSIESFKSKDNTPSDEPIVNAGENNIIVAFIGMGIVMSIISIRKMKKIM